jgi:hypothetical protein
LTDIYADIDKELGNDNLQTMLNAKELCQAQLLNHQTRNLLSSSLQPNNNNNDTSQITEEYILTQAIENMQSFFTLIGLTEQVNATVEMVGKVFPWMAREISGSDTVCEFPHANSSPRNNGCGINGGGGHDGGHWDLPDEPDEATRQAIEDHNQIDLKLYQAAVQHFELQKRALGLDL